MPVQLNKIYQDRSGKRYGMLRVAWPEGFDVRGGPVWLCICDCGQFIHKAFGIRTSKYDHCGCSPRKFGPNAGKKVASDTCRVDGCEFPKYRRMAVCRTHLSEYRRQARKPKRERGYKLKLAYGITNEEKDARIANQGYKCANLGCLRTTPGGRGWATDHDHVTGQLRGELCAFCNTALGMVSDNILKLEGLIEYIKKWKMEDGQVVGSQAVGLPHEPAKDEAQEVMDLK